MQYLFQNNEVRETNYDDATLAAFSELDDARRPVFLPDTDPRVAAFLAAQAEAAKPQEVTMRQWRLALLEANVLTAVEKSIAAMPDTRGQAARIEWEYGTSLKRGQPLVLVIADALKFTTAQMDDIFLAASQK